VSRVCFLVAHENRIFVCDERMQEGEREKFLIVVVVSIVVIPLVGSCIRPRTKLHAKAAAAGL
jgi:hypothetical protein